MRTFRLLAPCSAALLFAIPVAHADEITDLKAQLEAMQRQMDATRARLDQVIGEVQKQAEVRKPAQAAAPEAANSAFLQRKEGEGVTFLTRGGEVSLYGNLDLSLDDTTKGLQSSYPIGGSPVGRVGWLPAISTNLSYAGIRGRQTIASELSFVYQLETQIDIAATAGTVNTNSNNDTVVKGALTSRNSFIGLAGSGWGAVKIGKTDAPYKTSTARMNPFSGMLGDYAVVMGNTGGDNRVEFGTRLDHSLWYESPKLAGFTVAVLASPGQNRAFDNSLIAAGESSCAGGNAPGSGAAPPACNDGAFGSVYSASAGFDNGPLFLTTAYEVHRAVNRSGDMPNLDPNDIGDETAAKVGAQYAFPTGTTVSAIWEDMKRKIPAYLDYQNERSRTGSWLALTQVLTPGNNVSIGWARANATPGDTGQHNTPGGAHPDNAANMVAIAFKHALDRQTTVYADWALSANHAAAHYDLGAGGRTVTTDCHDGAALAAFDPTASNGAGGVTGSGPHCFAGGRLQGVSIGLDYKF